MSDAVVSATSAPHAQPAHHHHHQHRPKLDSKPPAAAVIIFIGLLLVGAVFMLYGLMNDISDAGSGPLAFGPSRCSSWRC